MQLRNLNIGSRLSVGFGVILLGAAAMLTAILVNGGSERTALLDTLQLASTQQGLAEQMHQELLTSAIAVRNMGLQTKVEAVQKDEAQAKQHRALYLAAKAKLEGMGLGAQELALFVTLTEVDRQSDVYFKEAVDLASQFNTDQAALVITSKIDPLFVQASTTLTAFIGLQKQRTDEAIGKANSKNAQMIRATVLASVIILAIATLLAWQLKNSITRPLYVAMDATTKIAAGDLTAMITAEGRDEAALLLNGLVNMQDRLADIVTNVRSGSESVANASAEIAQGNQDLSARTESQASALEQTAASMEELSAHVRQNADNAQMAKQFAADSSTVAIRGREIVARVVVTMKAINDSSRKISEIISAIDGIAFQTNILALNAAVEAARAGEQGRGFAVVASEVRSLAGRSADAAKEIKSLINASVERVEQGTSLVDEAGRTMTEIVAAIRKVSDLVGEISSASNEQAAGVAQVSEAISQMDQTTQQNAALVEQMAAAASSLKSQAGELVETVAVFKLDAQEGMFHQATHPNMPNTRLTQNHKQIATALSARSKIGTSNATYLSVTASSPKPPSESSPEWESF